MKLFTRFRVTRVDGKFHRTVSLCFLSLVCFANGCALEILAPSSAGGGAALTMSGGAPTADFVKVLSLNERLPLTSASTLGAPTSYELESGSGVLDPVTGLFTAPGTSDISVIRAIDSAGNFKTASLSTHDFEDSDSFQSLVSVASGAHQMTVDSSGRAFVIGSVSYDSQGVWHVREWDGTSWKDIDDYRYPNSTYAASPTEVAVDSHGIVYVIGWAWDSSAYTHWIVRRWDGTAWSTIDDYHRSTAFGFESRPSQIYIDGSDQVYVTGTSIDDSLTRHWIVRKWNGTSWSTVDDYLYPASTKDARATAIIADSVGNLYVIGNAANSSNATRWIVRKWDGTSWSTIDDYQYGTSYLSVATSIAFDSQGRIFVTGSGIDGSHITHWLTREWDGTSWSTTDDYIYSGAQAWGGGSASSLMIDSSDHVYAAGSTSDSSSHYHEIVRKWDGTSWSTVDDYTYPGFQFTQDCRGVMVAGDKIYVASDVMDGAGTSRVVVRQWDGTSWSTVDDDSTATEYSSYADSAGNVYVLMETSTGWTVRERSSGGTWSTLDQATFQMSSASGSLSTVTPQGEVYALGYVVSAGKDLLTVRKWDGTSWTLSDSYDFSSSFTYFQPMRMASDSTGQVYIIGWAMDSSSNSHWVVRRWDGSSWSNIDDYQYTSGQSAEPDGIAIDRNDNVYVVGLTTTAASNHWLVRKWDGTSWSLIDDYTYQGTSYAAANGVAVDSQGRIYVVGMAMDGSSARHTVTRRWDGTSWSVSDDYLYPGSTYTPPYNVVVDPSDHVFVLAEATDASSKFHWVTRKWDGTSWSTSDDFQYQATWARPGAIYVAPSGRIYETGMAGSATQQHWIVRQWDGTTWSTLDDYVYPGSSTQAAEADRLAFDGAGNVYVSGTAIDSTGTSHSVVRKWNGFYVDTIQDYSALSTDFSPSDIRGNPVDGAVYLLGTQTDLTAGSTWIMKRQL